MRNLGRRQSENEIVNSRSLVEGKATSTVVQRMAEALCSFLFVCRISKSLSEAALLAPVIDRSHHSLGSEVSNVESQGR